MTQIILIAFDIVTIAAIIYLACAINKSRKGGK